MSRHHLHDSARLAVKEDDDELLDCGGRAGRERKRERRGEGKPNLAWLHK